MKNNLKQEIQNCNKHPNFEVSLLRFHKDLNQVLSCSCCVEEQDELYGISSISYQKMIESNDTSYYPNWPPYEKENSVLLKNQLQNTFESIGQQENEQNASNIKNYFRALRIQIESKISAIEQKFISQLNNQIVLESNLIKEYNSISKKAEIKYILKDSNKSIHQKNSELKKIVDEILDKKQLYSKTMQRIVTKIQDQQRVSLDQLEKAKSQIIGNLDIFYQYMDDKNDVLNQQQLQSNLSTLSEILRNPFNQCKISFVDSLEQAMSSNFYLIKDIFEQEVFAEDQTQINYQNLTNTQVKDILRLTQSISKIPVNSSIKSDSFIKTKPVLEKHLHKVSQQQVIQNLLMRYPIFEFIPAIKDINSVKVSLMKSNYNQSGNQFQIFNQDTLCPYIDYDSLQLQAFCDFKINPQSKYIFKVEIINNCNRKNLQFGFGLGRDSQIHHNIYEQQMMYFSDGNWGIDTIIKGENLASFDISSKVNEFQIKVCLSQNILEVADLPSKNHIISINQQKSNLRIYSDLRFFLSFSSKYKKGDWIKVSSIEIVDTFYD